MCQSAIQYWDRKIHKYVRSEYWIDLGNVIPESGDTFKVMQGASKEYDIPKCVMEDFDGSELLLSKPFSEVLRYKLIECTPTPFFRQL
jgi:hypothetical protein